MSWVATVVVGTTVAGGVAQSNAAGDAAKKSRRATGKAADQAEALNRERYAEAESLMNPYIGRSEIASQQLMAEMGLPQYEVPIDQGQAGQPAQGYSYDKFSGATGGGGGMFGAGISAFREKQAEDEWNNRVQQSPVAPGTDQVPVPAKHQFQARDLTQLPGYENLMGESLRAVEQSAASSGSTAYGGRRLKEAGKVGAGVQQSYYSNYMNMLQNLSSPTTATNLAGMGVGQAQSIGSQNIAATNAQNDYRMQGTAAQNAAIGDAAGGITNIAKAFI